MRKYNAEARVFQRLHDRLGGQAQYWFRNEIDYSGRAFLVWGELAFMNAEQHATVINLLHQMEAAE